MTHYIMFGITSGGYTVGPKPLIDLLRQRSRPYLFSNSLPPPVVGCATRAVELLLASSEIAQSMSAKTMRWLFSLILFVVSTYAKQPLWERNMLFALLLNGIQIC